MKGLEVTIVVGMSRAPERASCGATGMIGRAGGEREGQATEKARTRRAMGDSGSVGARRMGVGFLRLLLVPLLAQLRDGGWQSDVECCGGGKAWAMDQVGEVVVDERAATSGGGVWQFGGVVEGRRHGVWSPIGWGRPESNPNDRGC